MFELSRLRNFVRILLLLLQFPGSLCCDVTTMHGRNFLESCIARRTGTISPGAVQWSETTYQGTTTPITRYSRSEMFVLRRQPPNETYVRTLYETGLLRYRGKRGGASTRARISRHAGSMLPARCFHSMPVSYSDDLKQLQVYRIETVVGQRPPRIRKTQTRNHSFIQN